MKNNTKKLKKKSLALIKQFVQKHDHVLSYTVFLGQKDKLINAVSKSRAFHSDNLKTCGAYAWVLPYGQVYVGRSKHLYKRLKHYVNTYSKVSSFKKTSLLEQYIVKYGLTNCMLFIFVCNVPLSNCQLVNLEQSLIDFIKSSLNKINAKKPQKKDNVNNIRGYK